MRPPRFLLHIPAHVLNGISVALGVAMVQAVLGAAGGFVAALTASSGAIFASLADTPLVPSRTWQRVLTGAAVGCTASVAVTLLKPYPGWLGLETSLLAFVSLLAMAWGSRAGPISFIPVLALVFALATPAVPGWEPLLEHAGWTVVGALLYLGWAWASSTLLQPRLRTLALADALDGTAALLRSRAGLLVQPELLSTARDTPLQAWIQRQTVLDERFQTARDLLFAVATIDDPAAPAGRQVQQQIALLLLAIDLRDNLLGSEADLDLLGRDAVAEQVRETLSRNLNDIAAALDRMALAVRLMRPYAVGEPVGEALVRANALDRRLRPPLAQALLNRANNMVFDLGRMQATLLGNGTLNLPLDRTQLQLFVSPEGWPLAALKPHMTLHSPVMRHALRVGVALGSAYFRGEALPWASHPHWLVLSVAVVLRGNLEQTLARRDARVAGTTIGCLLVALLARFASPTLSTVIFLVAVGVAHSFVMRRYLFSAIAATLMALLQAHLVHPEDGYGVAERLGDTLLGAALAWGFSYLLPWWERRSIGNLVPRVLQGLNALAVEALRWPEADNSDLKLRLARRSAYEAIGGIAAAAQRTEVEPMSVRVPLYALAGLLTRCHVLLAHLAAVRTLLTRRSAELDPEDARPALEATTAQLGRLLAADATAAFDDSGLSPPSSDLEGLPAATDVLQPWLQRRLQVTAHAAAGVAEAARALRAAAA